MKELPKIIDSKQGVFEFQCIDRWAWGDCRISILRDDYNKKATIINMNYVPYGVTELLTHINKYYSKQGYALQP